MIRILIPTILLPSLFLSAPLAEATSSKVSYQFTASADEATVTVVRMKKSKLRKIGTCQTPCLLKLKPNHVDFVVFQHDDHPPLELSKEELPTHQEGTDPNIHVYGDLGISRAEKKAEAKRKYEKARHMALAKTNTEAKPWERIPPLYPMQSLVKSRSGWCQVRFDVNAQGSTENVSAFNCSESTFKENAEASVQKWVYIPAVKNGKFVSRLGKETILKFQFNDEDGNPVPAKIPLPK